MDIETITEIHDHRRQAHDDDKVKVDTKIVAKSDADIELRNLALNIDP